MNPERGLYWGYGLANSANRLTSIGALIVFAIGVFLIYRPKPKLSWVGTAGTGPENVAARYSLDTCKYALRKTGGDCAQPCFGREKRPSDCGSVIHVEPSK
jgi:hypothetical protein